MTELEYKKEKKKLESQINTTLKQALRREIPAEEHLKVVRQWKEFLNNAKKEDWFKHI